MESKLLPKIGKGVRKLGNYIHSFTPGAYAHKRSMKAWREQTEYNSPKNQVARLREAGLAPQLMYGQGTTAATGQADPAPNQEATTGTPLLAVLGQFTDMARTISQTVRDAREAQGKEIENIWNRYFTLGKLDKNKSVQASERSWLLDRESTLVLWKKLLTEAQRDQVIQTQKKLEQDTRYKKFENDFRETYKINVSEGWKVKLAISIIEALGGNVSDQNILKLLGNNISE
jgi:hypothetical protein